MARTPIDPKLSLIVVGGVTFVFVVTALLAAIRGKPIASEWFLLMGSVAGGVLGYGMLRRDR